MSNETKFFEELRDVHRTVKSVRRESDGTLIVSREIETVRERIIVARDFEKLTKDLEGDKSP